MVVERIKQLLYHIQYHKLPISCIIIIIKNIDIVENLKPLHIFTDDIFQYIYEECVDIKHPEVGFVRHPRIYTGYIITWCKELDEFLKEKVNLEDYKYKMERDLVDLLYNRKCITHFAKLLQTSIGLPLQVVIQLVYNFTKYSILKYLFLERYRAEVYNACYKNIIRLYKSYRSNTFDVLLQIILNLTYKCIFNIL